MPSTYSPNLRIELIGSGEQQNIWGNTTNTNLGTLLEDAISGSVVLSFMTDADYTLIALNGAYDEARSMTIIVPPTLTLTANRTITAPAVPKVYIVGNASLGGYSVGLTTGAGNTYYIPNNTVQTIFTDGTDFYLAGATTMPVLTNAGSTVQVGLS